MAFTEVNMLAWIRDLYTLSQNFTLRESSQQVAEQILRHLVSGFDADGGYLALPQETDTGGLKVVATQDLPQLRLGTPLNLEGGFIGAQEIAERDINQADPEREMLFRNDDLGIYLPLLMDSRIIGALRVHRREGSQPFCAEDWERGSIMVGLLAVVIDNRRLHFEQQRRIEELSGMNAEIRAINQQLEEAHNQLIQSEKMASIGQLAAGVAHEINNPIGYVYSNLGSLQGYLKDVFDIVDAYVAIGNQASAAGLLNEAKALGERLDIDFLKEDTHVLLAETREGITRVKKIVQDLKDFSHAGAEDDWVFADLHKGLDSTLNIVNNEIKYKAQVVKDYAHLPEISCQPPQLNQVFLNLLVNAAHAIESHGTITITTRCDDEHVRIAIADTGCGIKPEHLTRIFDPFFTTKPIGKGTGLGLSLSYGIVQKHGGRIEVDSDLGKGTTFCVVLPRTRPPVQSQAEEAQHA